ncbi:ACT domain-containing protein [bacterium]|nr:ACT domain-containing protein [bacterium]
MIRQLAVFLENKPGRLSALAECLSNGGVNIRALSVAETKDYGVIRFIPDDPVKAKEALKAEGYAVIETEVLAVNVPDKPGGLASVTKLLADAGINIEYAYASVIRLGESAIVILQVDDKEKASQILKNAGIRLLSQEDVKEI